MGVRFLQQPNGLFAVFSEIVDDFTWFDMTEDDAIAHCDRERWHLDKFERCKEHGCRYRWHEAIRVIDMVHGRSTAIERAVQTGASAELARRSASSDPPITFV